MKKDQRYKNLPKDAKLQFITNQWSETSISEQVEQVCQGGCRWIQLRLKDTSPAKWIEIGQEVRTICKNYGAKFIINDHVEFAFRADADGVHLGKEDMDPEKARQILGPDKIIGGTANTYDDIEHLDQKGADYVGLGPFRNTSTKQKLAPLIGISGYQHITQRMKANDLDLPVFAIGGITPEDIPQIFTTGITGIVISSFLSNNSNVRETTEQLIRTIHQTADYVNTRQ